MSDNNHLPDSGKVNEPPKAGNTELIKTVPPAPGQSAPIKPKPPAAEAAPKTVTPSTAEKAPENKSVPTPAKQPAPTEKTAPRDKGSPAAGKDAPSKDKEPPAKPAPEEKQTTIPGMEAPAGKVVDFATVKDGAAKGTQADKSSEAPKSRRGRLSKKDKPAPGKTPPPPRDKTSRSKELHSPAPGSAAKVTAADRTAAPPRPVEDQKVVYLKLSEVHPFHTYREHPFSVRDDAKMQETVASIKRNGVMVPGLARPEKDGNGYEIISGHRRHRGSELAGLAEMPFIVREMTDHEAVQAMKDSNKQRGEVLPMEMARLLDLEMEDIKHQGVALKNVAPGDISKRSAEIVGEAHGMNYKKVMRYIRLNSLVPELQDMVDGVAVNSSGEPMKKLGFIPAVELSYRSISRSEAAAIFARLLSDKLGERIPGGYHVPFTDVDADAWYAGYVEYLTGYGIAVGHSDGTYQGEQPITRAEFTAMAVRFFDVYGDGDQAVMEHYRGFDDVSPGHWAAGYIEDAARYG